VIKKRTVLFLCTGNSCRSQIAEAITNARLGNQWRAFSAGTEPAGYVHPLAIKALAEIDIRHKGASKSTEVFRNVELDVVITVCNDAENKCPVWLGQGKKVHIGFIDPAKAIGSENDQMEVFRKVRDEIVERIPVFLENWGS